MIAKFDMTLSELDRLLQSKKTVNIALDFGVSIQSFRKMLKQAGFQYESRKWRYKGQIEQYTATINEVIQKDKFHPMREEETSKSANVEPIHSLTMEEMEFLGQAFTTSHQKSHDFVKSDVDQLQVTNQQIKSIMIQNDVLEKLHMFCLQHNINIEEFIDLAIIEAMDKYEIV